MRLENFTLTQRSRMKWRVLLRHFGSIMLDGISHAALSTTVTKLKRLEGKRKPIEGKVSLQLDDSGKRTRPDHASTYVGEEVCFFCGGAATEGNPLSRASPMELDSRVRAVTMEANDFNLLRKLNAGTW